MNIVHINFEDVIGRRFNGYDLCKYYNTKGNNASMYVRLENGSGLFVHKIWPDGIPHMIWRCLAKMEQILSVQNILYPPILFYRKGIRKADVIHLNLLSNDFINFFEIALLSKIKPTILSLHDFSLFSGHCSHPEEECTEWQNGCKYCSYHDKGVFPLRYDNSKFLWKYKHFVWSHSNLQIIVPSQWLLNIANKSPMFEHCSKHMVPYGVDLNVFKPLDKEKIRKQLNIKPGSFVIFFRALDSPYKGLDVIREALRKIKISKPVCCITLNGNGLFDEFKNDIQLIEKGWQSDPNEISKLFNASDIFLMPSLRETFGMMAAEAMACGIPSIVTKDTPLKEVTKAPKAAIAIPSNDSRSLVEAIHFLASDNDLYRNMSVTARELACKYYDFDKYADKLKTIYQNAINAFQNK